MIRRALLIAIAIFGGLETWQYFTPRAFGANSQMLWNEPITQPEYITRIYPSVLLLQHNICVGIDQKVLWKPGDELKLMSRQLIDSMRVTVDDEKLIAGDDLMVLNATGGLHVFGGNYHGPYTFRVNACVPIADDLRVGIHNLRIEFENLHGTHYKYAFAFEVAKRPRRQHSDGVILLTNDS